MIDPTCASPEVIFCEESSSNGEQGELDYIRRQIVRAVMRRDQDKALFVHTRGLIKNYTRKSAETPEQFFRNHAEYFCEYLAQQMLDNLFTGSRRSKGAIAGSGEPPPKNPRFDLFESWVEKLTKLFGFYEPENAHHSIKSLVEEMAQHLVPVFIISRKRHKEIAQSLVDQISEITRMDRRMLIYKYWDGIFERWVLAKIREPAVTADIDTYLYHWIQNNRLDYYAKKTLRSMFRALLCLSLNEQFVLSLVEDIHRHSTNIGDPGVPFSLSAAIRRFFTKIVFDFRDAITAHHSERPRMAIKSLAILMEYLDKELINENSQNLLIILKAATVSTGEFCVPTWIKFISKLDTNSFLILAPQIIFAISPLLKYENSKLIFNEILVNRSVELNNCKSTLFKVNRTLIAMLDNNTLKLERRLPPDLTLSLASQPHFVVVNSCAELLVIGSVDSYQIILERVLRVLDSCDLLQINAGKLARALICALQRVLTPELKWMIGKSLGVIGLLDLEGTSTALTDRSEEDTTVNSSIVLVDARAKFCAEFLKGILCKIGECEPSGIVAQIHHCIFFILTVPLKNEGLDGEVWKQLPKEAVATLNTIRDSSLKAISKDGPDLSRVDDIFEHNTTRQLPFIEHSANFDIWIRNLFYSGASKLNDHLLRHLFATLVYINHPAIVSKIMCTFYPHVIVQSIIEKNELIMTEFEQEVFAVFDAIINDRCCWANELTHAVFCIFDVLEKIALCRGVKDTFRKKDKIGVRLNQLVAKVVGQASPDSPVPLSVLVARKCNYHFRAMRWLEQFALPKENFRREFYFALEQLYAHLENCDGVLGTFQVIRDHAIPEPREHILALKMEGNFVDVLPFCQNIPGQEQEMIKCLLRSNQPLLAQTCIEYVLRQKQADMEMAQTEEEGGGDKAMVNRLREYQMEAVCKLGDWDQLAMLRRDLDNSRDIQQESGLGQQEESWGAQIASIFCDLKQFDQHKFDESIRRARLSLANSLRTITLEGSRTIAQTHWNIIKLRSLYEMERVMAVLYSGGDKSMLIRKIINYWERQYDNSLSFVGQSEPIISLRRELLRAVDLPNTTQTQCRLLLKCSELARNAKHLQRSWTYIAEAKALNGPKGSIAIDMEESNYLFQKGNQFEAISLLDKSIGENFSEFRAELNRESFSALVRDSTSFTPNISSADITGSFRTRRGSFVEAELLLANFNEQAGAKQMEDLLGTYKQLEGFGEHSEYFYYRYATFYDGYCESAKELSCEMICNLLRLYHCVLKFGPRYINHAIPRMLTIWLDLAPKCSLSEAYGVANRQSSSAKKSRKIAQQPQQQQSSWQLPHDPNREMKQSFDQLDKSYFFASFAQMISRITHSDPTAYALLKEMLADLIVHFPHRSMWLSLSVSRSVRVAVRSKRCIEIFELAKKKAKDGETGLNVLIQQYDYLAAALLKIAETRVNQQSGLVFDNHFPFIADFFNTGRMRADIQGRSLGRNSDASFLRPQLLLPFVDEICPSSSGDKRNKHPGTEVFIHGVDTHFDCLKSLESPKKLSFIGTDGKKYPLLCKQGDDLCKDARFMDVNRMLNTLFARDTDTKNQLYIRCYSVIPLKESGGGIIQWVPNLATFANSLRTIMHESTPVIGPQEMHRLFGEGSNSNLSTLQRVKMFRDQICARFPLSMAIWLRRTFPDACSWYHARLAFTRTAATMSMVGFLLGLGDRHGENILLDVKTGDLIHVDFNILFDKGETLKVPEIVPFRLTRNMIDGFGATGVEGAFRKSCEKALKVMRTEKRMLGTVLQAFAHDPLVEWSTTEARNQQHRQYGGTTLQSQDNAEDTIDKIKMRLAGHIVTARFHPPKACAVPMSVEGQVAKLIEIARDDANLSRMYIGWSAYL